MSVTIAQKRRRLMDEFLDTDKNRSRFLEQAASTSMATLHRAQQNTHDLKMINQRADSRNAKVSDE